MAEKNVAVPDTFKKTEDKIEEERPELDFQELVIWQGWLDLMYERQFVSMDGVPLPLTWSRLHHYVTTQGWGDELTCLFQTVIRSMDREWLKIDQTRRKR